MVKKKRIYKEDVTWRIDPTILQDFKVLVVKNKKHYSEYIEELMKQEIEKEKENENKNQD